MDTYYLLLLTTFLIMFHSINGASVGDMVSLVRLKINISIVVVA